ncbi:hypothetical protein [Actinomadura sp. 3N407]|uniref:hypothetical protein n=1 Tax=Actinomadura sp. 3N407 TaxID=3457423 RepID=UPI003FCC5725
MTGERPDALLEQIACRVWEATRRHGLEESCCIAATRITREVARYFGVHGGAQPVRVLVANQAAVPLITAGTPPAGWPEDAWSTGSDGTRLGPDGYGGHLVFTAHRQGVTHLVDPSLPQYARPRLRLPLTPLATRLDGRWPGPPRTTSDTRPAAGPAAVAADDLTAGIPADAPGAGDAVAIDVNHGRGVVVYRPLDDGGRYRRSPDWTDRHHLSQRIAGEVIRSLRSAQTQPRRHPRQPRHQGDE